MAKHKKRNWLLPQDEEPAADASGKEQPAAADEEPPAEADTAENTESAEPADQPADGAAEAVPDLPEPAESEEAVEAAEASEPAEPADSAEVTETPAESAETETAEAAEESGIPGTTAEVDRIFAGEDAETPSEEAPAEDAEEYDEDNYDDYDEIEAREKDRRRRRRKHRRRRKGRGLSCSLVLLTLIICSAVVLSVVILTVVKEIYGIEKDVNERNVRIPSGATTIDIAEQLQRENIISLPTMFRLISRMNGMDGKYIAGEHVISPSMSYQAMINELCKNHEEDREYVRVTFREGITLLDAARILQENEVCQADAFIWAFNAGGYGFNFENYLTGSSSLKFYRMEGYCFPDTYDFYVDEDPNIVAQKIYENFDSKITPAYYTRMQDLGMSLDEVITLASIVQAEAPYPEEMRKVSSVFHNRLVNSAVFTKLQSDPTRKYVEDVIRPNQQIQNTLMQEAYNTYEGTGLPPGAINNPGKAAIEAVLYPADTNYYFFVANVDTRVTYYATTNEEHEANVAKVRQEQAEAAAAQDD